MTSLKTSPRSDFDWECKVFSVKSKGKRGSAKRKDCANAKIPRILLLDIRKCYAKMLVNVMNSQDFPLLFGFIDTYFSPFALHASTKIVRKGYQRKQYSMNVYGTEEIAKFWYSFMNLSPDGVTTLTDSTIQHTTGKIVSSLHKDGTQLFELAGRLSPNDYLEYILIDDLQQEKVSFSSKGAEEETTENQKKRKIEVDSMDDKIRRMRGIMMSVDTAVSRLALRKYPLQISMNGSFTISTDENRKIVRIEACVEY